MHLKKNTTIKEAVVKGFLGTHANGRVEALSDVSFDVAPGQVLGVVGHNGSGKSTLLRLLAGIYQPDAGSISIAGTITPLLSLAAGFHPDLTGRENVRMELLVLGFSPPEIAARMPEIIAFSGIGDFVDAPLRSYSVGMIMRLAFSAAMSVDPDILLLDEVLAVGDEAFAMKCLERIWEFKRAGKAIVLVTHSSQVVIEQCDVALWLDHGRVAGFGAPGDIIAAYRASAAEQSAG